jgi:outer membrane protein OmpA-like peptidoglycan-associated protein
MYGKCQNKSGCTLAYTSELIQFSGAPRCPECGLILVAAKPKSNVGPRFLFLMVGLLFVLCIVGTIVWAVRSVKHSVAPSSASAISATSPFPIASSTKGQLPPELQNLPEPNQTEASESSSRPAVDTPPKLQTETATTPQVVANPQPLPKKEIDNVRNDVLKRIHAIPKLSEQDKDKLSQKMETAHSMERLQVIYFGLGKTTLPKQVTASITKSFSNLESKLADPTVVLIVAGYADQGGAANVNQRVSQQRADSVTKILKDQVGISNLIHPVAMGGTDLLNHQRPNQNRAVEIWMVTP